SRVRGAIRLVQASASACCVMIDDSTGDGRGRAVNGCRVDLVPCEIEIRHAVVRYLFDDVEMPDAANDGEKHLPICVDDVHFDRVQTAGQVGVERKRESARLTGSRTDWWNADELGAGAVDVQLARDVPDHDAYLR